MAWRMTGQLHELCSCNMWCPCWLGPEIEPDQGWCGGAILLDIEQGVSDGVNLDGCKAVWLGDWPANFWAELRDFSSPGVPSALAAPYRFECESLPTTRLPGVTYPCSTITWWQIPVPAG